MKFLEEFERLKLKTFRTSGYRSNSTNSDYTHNIKDCKNCYLISNAINNQDCMYGRDFYDNQDCIDCDHTLKCTLCYEAINCKACYDCSHLIDCDNCLNCDYGYYLKDCKNCIGCVGLRRKEFHIFNEPYSREDFFEKKKSLRPEKIQRRYEDLQLKVPRVYSVQINTENCIGNYIHNSKNIFYGFDVIEGQDCAYIAEAKKSFDCIDCSFLEESTACYNISSCHSLNNCNFCYLCGWLSDSEYCEWVLNSRYCFGCVSLNHKEYHILNQAYPREDYFKKVAEIKQEMKRDYTYGRVYLEPSYPLADTVATWPRL